MVIYEENGPPERLRYVRGLVTIIPVMSRGPVTIIPIIQEKFIFEKYGKISELHAWSKILRSSKCP
jgi:hypothetical protein